MDMDRMLHPWYKRWWGILILVTLFILLTFLVAFGLLTYAIYRDIKNDTFDSASYFPKTVSDEAVSGLTSSEDIVFVSKDDDPRLGNSQNPLVTIIAFEDFQCPFCREAFPTVKQIMSEYRDVVEFVYRDFPISEVHPYAQKAAEAGECADDQGKFWELHDLIYDNQEKMDVPDLKRYASDLGLDMARFGACLDGSQYAQEVEADFVYGARLGVTGTPTFYINGHKVVGAIPLDIFRKIMQSEIVKAQGKAVGADANGTNTNAVEDVNYNVNQGFTPLK